MHYAEPDGGEGSSLSKCSPSNCAYILAGAVPAYVMHSGMRGSASSIAQARCTALLKVIALAFDECARPLTLQATIPGSWDWPVGTPGRVVILHLSVIFLQQPGHIGCPLHVEHDAVLRLDVDVPATMGSCTDSKRADNTVSVRSDRGELQVEIRHPHASRC